MTALKLQKPDRVPFMEWWFDREIGESILGRKDYTREDIAEALCMDGMGSYTMPEVYSRRATSMDGREYETGGLLAHPDDLKRIILMDPKDLSNYDHVKRHLEKYGKRFAIFAGTHIGLDPLLRGMGIDNFSYALMDDIKLIEDILDIYTDWAAEAVLQFQKIGVDMIWFADDIAFTTSLMFSPDFFREVAKPRMKKVMDNIKIPVLYHSDGNIVPVIADLIELGIKGIHPMDPCALDIGQVKREYGNRVCLIGNIDLSYTLVNGTVEEVKNEVRSRIEEIGYNGGYILSSANSITSYCKTENILAMRDALLEFGHD